ncbi:MAG: MopE-related protein [Bradymonadia bacterium]
MAWPTCAVDAALLEAAAREGGEVMMQSAPSNPLSNSIARVTLLTLLTALLGLTGCGDNAKGVGGNPVDAAVEADAFNPICEATGLPRSIELCDGIDNDCDGIVDDNFNLQVDPDHCGSCNNACADLNGGEAPGDEVQCREGRCLIRTCPAGRTDADGNIANGCEGTCALVPGAEICDGVDNDCDGRADEGINIQIDVLNCGACGNVCDLANAAEACVEGECVVEACDLGFFDRDEDPTNGCEGVCDNPNPGPEICDEVDNDCDDTTDEGFDLDTDLENCGTCGNRCSFANAGARCDAGACAMAACDPGFADLDNDVSNGCESLIPDCPDPGPEVCDGIDNDCNGIIDDGIDKLNDPLNCGGCGNVDEAFICNPPNAVAACVQGECAVETCVPPFIDLDLDPANGCEFECEPTGEEICDGEDNDCDSLIDEDFDFQASTDHCGRCGNSCDFDNAVAACVGGNCRINSCDAGFFNLDLAEENGCEYNCPAEVPGQELCDAQDNDCDGRTDEGFNLFSDANNCGRCDNVCAFENAQALCSNSTCALGLCAEGFVDANLQPGDGCEYECTPSAEGFERCNDVDDDCDTRTDEDFDLQTDVNNCGECGTRCTFPNGRVQCNAGTCAVDGCQPGFIDLDGEAGNGCEYACTPADPAVEICNGLDDDCDGTTDEGFDLSTLDNCGACGAVCRFDEALSSCDEGICRFEGCNAGFIDANGTLVDGCETACVPNNDGNELCNEVDDDCDGLVDEDFNLSTDVDNCGQCGLACALDNAEPYCDNGTCALLACADGFVDTEPGGGCECPLQNGGRELCNGIDDDCNGVIDDAERVAPPPDFDCLPFGVCAGVAPACTNGDFVCAYPATYQADESRCDGIDNDCDGLVDEGFDGLGAPCFDGVGACQVTGEQQCNEAGDAVICSATAQPPEVNDESACDGIDEDCDGIIDEGTDVMVSIPAGDGVPAFTIYAYEASRTDAAAGDQGQSFLRACSKPGVQPWRTVDYDTAAAACAAAGLTLCSGAQWSRVCAGDGGEAYPYGNAYVADACNGQDFDTDPNTDGNQDDVLVVGSMAQCTRDFNGASVYDLSGNLWEWTSEDPTGEGTARNLRGGSAGNIAGGLSCDFSNPAPPATSRDNIGFRCCQ